MKVSKNKSGAGADLLPLGVVETDDELQELLTQFGGASGYRVHLERTEPRALAGYLGTVDLTLDFLDVVKAMVGGGGGAYGGRVSNDDGYVKRIRFRISGNPNAATSTSPNAGAGETDLLRFMREQAEANRELLRELRANANAGGPVKSLDDFLTVARALRELNTNTAPGQTPVDQLEMMNKVFELQDRIEQRMQRGGNGNGDNDSDLRAIMRDGVGPLLRMGGEYIEAVREKNAIARGVPVNADKVVNLARQLSGMVRNFLASKAAGGGNPELYAEVACDQLSDKQKVELFDLLNTETNFGVRIAAAVPEFAGRGEWFENFGVAAHKLLGAWFAANPDKAPAPPASTSTDSASVRPINGGRRRRRAAGAQEPPPE